MKRSFIVFVLMISAIIIFSNVEDSTLEIMKDHQVIIEKTDGSEVAGKILGYDEVNVIISKNDGRIVTIRRNDISILRQQREALKIAQHIKPLGRSAFDINVLGFLQFGPTLSLDLKFSEDIMAGVHLRLQGLGLLYQMIATDGFNDYAAPWALAPGFQFKYFFPNQMSSHRIYIGFLADLGFGWSSGDHNTIYEWKASYGGLVIAANFGYRWRFPSGFYTNVGILAGYYIEIWHNWYYINVPSVVFEDRTSVIFGMLELVIGWEKTQK